MLHAIQNDGYAIIPAVFAPHEVDEIAGQLAGTLGAASGGMAVRTRNDAVYAARNVDEWFPQALTLWRQDRLIELLRDVLGEQCGLVRVLYFDKPPAKPWSLPWHKDMTIAVVDNELPSEHFTNPTTKAGIPHVEAPEELLQRMLTLRIHLDDVDETNGPLTVIPGSDRSGKRSIEGGSMSKILVQRGDVLAMRPLVSHSSPLPTESASKARRILHFEFAADRELADGYRWRLFDPLASQA